jgi:transcriptional regulator with XRE-family HTH domain
MSDFASRLRAARAFADLTQEELATMLGVDPQTIKRREAGKQNPKRVELVAIASITSVPLAFLEGGWEALAAPPDAERIRQAAALLRPALAEVARELGLAPAEAPSEPDGLDHPGEGRGAGAA